METKVNITIRIEKNLEREGETDVEVWERTGEGVDLRLAHLLREVIADYGVLCNSEELMEDYVSAVRKLRAGVFGGKSIHG